MTTPYDVDETKDAIPITLDGPTELHVTTRPGSAPLGAGDRRFGSVFVISLHAEMLPY